MSFHESETNACIGLIFKQFAQLITQQLVACLVRVVKADLDGLAAAAVVVAKGGTICYPTDTVYGLGCDPLNVQAIEKVIRAKGFRTRAMPVLVRGLEAAERIAYFSNGARKLARKFWPGPLTIVLPAKEALPRLLAPERTVGVRSPRHVVCLDLLGLCSGNLVGTSANLTGKPPATEAEDAASYFSDKVDLVLDGGKAPIGVSSTVVDLTKDRLTVLREGPIARPEIMKCLKGARQDSY
jgi:L-threonylcarbamoyladenylate synthase